MLRHLFKCLRSGHPVAKTAKRHLADRRGYRPVLEALEDRWAPAVLIVNSLADGVAPGSGLTLRAAVQIVDGTLAVSSGAQGQISGTLGSNDTIQFALPSGAQTITLTGGALVITNPVTINGPGAGSLTITGNGLDRVFTIGQSLNLNLHVAISGVTISGGNQAYGGGILNNATLTVSNATFASNTAGTSGGGAIYNTGTLTVSNSTFSGNTVSSVSDGGGIKNVVAGTVTVRNSTFSGNNAQGSGSTAASGGALANSGVMTVSATTIAGSTVASDGGGVYNDGTLTMTGCTLVNNTAGSDGGGIRSGGTLTLTNCTFWGNSAASWGGGIDSSDVAMTATNCTFVNNSAGSLGGGIKDEGIAGNNPPKLFNTLVAGNTRGVGSAIADDLSGAMDATSAFNLIGTGGSGGLLNGTNNNQVGVANAGVGSLANNGGPTQTIALFGGSPALGQGSNAYVTAGETDQRGLARVVNGTVDVGAFEGQMASTAASDQSSNTGTATLFNLGSFSDNQPTAGPWNVDVNWGDGSADTTFTAASAGTLQGQSHVFNTSGTDTVSVTVTDSNHDSSKTTFHVVVTGVNIPAVLTVNSLGDTTTAGTVLTLREAIELVDGTLGRTLTQAEQSQITGTLGNNNTIQFNLPAGPGTITLGSALDITSPVTINGPGAGNLTINGNNVDRDFIVGQVFTQNLALNVAINGLTIAGGSQVYGGGLLNFGTLTLSNVTFANNTAGSSGGGAIYNDGALTVNNSTFNANAISSVGTGAAIENITTGTATVNNCTFTANAASGSGSTAGSGGAIGNSGVMTVNNSTLSGNSAASDGGAIFTDGTLTVNDSTFANNTCGSDGGAIRAAGTVTLNNSTFWGNTAASVGGAIDASVVAMTVTNCTFADNTAGSAGGAINNEGLTGNNPPTFDNTLVAGNLKGQGATAVADDIAGPVAATSAFNLIGTGGSGGLTAGVNNNQVGVSSPGIGTLANNGGPTQTVALLPGSPAIGHGSTAYVTAGETDQRGSSRKVNGTVDIGAFEVQPTIAAFTITMGSPMTAGTAGTFTVTARDANGNVVTGYLGTVHFTTSDGQANLPANYTFLSSDNGAHTFNVTFATPGSQTVTATDTAQQTVTATSPAVTVSAVVSTGGSGGSGGSGTTTGPATLPVGVGPGITTIGSTLYLVGGNGNDDLHIHPIGSSNTGSTGISVDGKLNNLHINNQSFTGITTVYVVGLNGNDHVEFAGSLTIAAVISEGDGNDQVHLGNGNNTVILGNGNDQVQLGNGNNTVTVGNGNDQVQLGNGNNVVGAGTGNVNIKAGDGTNSVTAGARDADGNIQIQLGDGDNDIVMLLGDGNDQVHLGDGDNDCVSITGNGNDQVQTGEGSGDSVSIIGDGNDDVKPGSGSCQVHLAGCGHQKPHPGS